MTRVDCGLPNPGTDIERWGPRMTYEGMVSRDSTRKIPAERATMPKQRTDWAERHVEEFLSLPLISEFVFRSPQTLDGTQKEVADLLVAHDGVGLLISQKCQEQPMSRDHDKTAL
jgi:hypothetical protein